MKKVDKIRKQKRTSRFFLKHVLVHHPCDAKEKYKISLDLHNHFVN
jgi:hypothetical protein